MGGETVLQRKRAERILRRGLMGISVKEEAVGGEESDESDEDDKVDKRLRAFRSASPERDVSGEESDEDEIVRRGPRREEARRK